MWMTWANLRVELMDGTNKFYENCGVDPDSRSGLWIFKQDDLGSRDYVALFAMGVWKEVQFGDRAA